VLGVLFLCVRDFVMYLYVRGHVFVLGVSSCICMLGVSSCICVLEVIYSCVRGDVFVREGFRQVFVC
jgi:hypothetical protein